MMVADMHRNMLTGQEGASGKNYLVGVTRYTPTTGCLLLPRLKPGQRY